MLYTQHNKDKRHRSLEKYTSHFIERVVCERELETKQNCNILTPTLLAISAFLSHSPGLLNWGPSPSGTCSSIQHLLSNWSDPQLTDFLSSPRLYSGVPSSNECLGYDIKQSDDETPVMLELWGMWHTPSLPSLPGPLWPGVVSPDKVLSMGQIELFDIWIECKQMTNAKLNCLK